MLFCLDGNRGLPDLEHSLAWKSSKPFSDKSQCEKEELYERIAEQLAAIADKLNLESPRSVRSSGQSAPEDEKAEICGSGKCTLLVDLVIWKSHTLYNRVVHFCTSQ